MARWANRFKGRLRVTPLVALVITGALNALGCYLLWHAMNDYHLVTSFVTATLATHAALLTVLLLVFARHVERGLTQQRQAATLAARVREHPELDPDEARRLLDEATAADLAGRTAHWKIQRVTLWPLQYGLIGAALVLLVGTYQRVTAVEIRVMASLAALTTVVLVGVRPWFLDPPRVHAQPQSIGELRRTGRIRRRLVRFTPAFTTLVGSLPIAGALFSISALLSWLAVSSVWIVGRPALAPLAAIERVPTGTVTAAAAARAEPGGTRTVLAVALSGGGYRAAAFHAGVLSVLHDLPVRYLSTVSGGSIVGAHYALGRAPEEFLDRLQRPPLLFNDLYNAWAMLGSFFASGYTLSDAYVAHLERVYYGAATFASLSPARPELLVNATNFRTGLPWVFSAGQTPSVRLAKGVAASASLPPVIGPVSITVPPAFDPIPYIDGAARDNLGLDSLWRSVVCPNRQTRTVVLASNATRPLRSDTGEARKITILEASLRLYDTLMHEIQGQLLGEAIMVGSPPRPLATVVRPVDCGGARTRRVFVVVAALRAEQTFTDHAPLLRAIAHPFCRGVVERERTKTGLPQEEQVKRIVQQVRDAAEIATFQELTRAQVERASCAGVVVMTARLPTLRCHLARTRDDAAPTRDLLRCEPP